MNNDQNKISKKNLIFMIFTIVAVLMTGTFAWLSYRTQDTAMVLTVGDIKGLTVTLKPYQIKGTLAPVSGYSSGKVVDVTAQNKSTTSSDNFRLFYDVETIDSALQDSGFKYTVTKSTDGGTNYIIVKEGNFLNASNGDILEIYQENVLANTTYLYKVYIWIDSSSGNQSNMQNKTFTAELRASVSQSLFTMIKNQAVMDNVKSTYVTNNNGIQFNDISSDTNGKGVYIRNGTENDLYPIYYYRGDVNNNVLFANFCWKIVRTTDTGGVKLIYNGVPSNGQCNNTGTASQLASTSEFNTGNSYSLANFGYMYGTVYERGRDVMTSKTGVYKYAKSFSYENGSYILSDEGAMNFAGSSGWSTNYNQLSNNHYTCFNASGTCTTVRYIYYTTATWAYYITLAGGKSVSNALSEMLTSSSNTTNSIVKTSVDNWYKNNMLNYTDKLEDTPWCNDRRIYSYSGWNATGGSTTSGQTISFRGLQRSGITYAPSLICAINDSFTVSNVTVGNGKLKYPVGLLAMDEAMLAGATYNIENKTHYLYTNNEYFTMTPRNQNNGYSNYVIAVKANGALGTNNTSGVRPMVSLKAGTRFTSGNGTKNIPYIVE